MISVASWHASRTPAEAIYVAEGLEDRLLPCADATYCQSSTNPHNLSMIPRLKYWIPAIMMAALISFLSTHYFSGEQPARVIYPILKWFFPGASHRTIHLMHVGIRKLAHVIEFGVFSVTVFLGVRGPRSGWKLNWALWTLLIAIAYAGLDEWHQSFVPLR